MIETILALLIQLAAAAALLGVAVCVSAWTQFRGARNGARLVLATLASAAVMFLFLFLVAFEGKSLFEHIRLDQVDWIGQQLKFYETKDLKPDQLSAMRVMFDSLYLQVLPGWLAVSCLFLGLLAVFPVGSLIAKLSPKFAAPEPYREFAIPEPMVFLFLGAGALLLAAPRMGWPEAVGTWSGSCLVFFAFLYFLEGVAVLQFFFWKWRLRPFTKFALYLLVFLAPSAVLGVATLGLLNLWVDFRKIKLKPNVENPQ